MEPAPWKQHHHGKQQVLENKWVIPCIIILFLILREVTAASLFSQYLSSVGAIEMQWELA